VSVATAKRVQIGGGVVLVAATVAWLSGTCAQKIRPGEVEPGAEEAGAHVVVVEHGIEPVLEQASGTVESARRTTVSSKILARILEVRVRAGDAVKAGDVVIVLDARDLDARTREAKEARAAAASQLELATSEQRRVESLFQSGVAPARDVDRAVSAQRVAAAELERAEQRLRDAEVGLSHGEIAAPVAGRVVDRLAEPGDTASPGVPLLGIYDPSVLRLEAPVREALAQHLAVGQSVGVTVGAIEERFEGTIEEIVPQAEPGARTFLVKVRFGPDPRVFAGMFGRIEVPAGQIERVRVPDYVVERVGQLELVTTVGADGKTSRRLVTTGARDPAGRVEILSGLVPGERVRVPGDAAE
jgi:RND family efflux transporter MFP subunit